MRTKWQILNAQREKAAEAYNKIMRQMEGLEKTNPPVPECRTCHLPFFTMGDFDRHYLVDNEQHLNLGNCPTRYNNGRLMPNLHDGWTRHDLWDEAHEANAQFDDEKVSS